MGVDATSKQTGGKDCVLEGAGLYYHTFIAVDSCFGNISNCSSMMIWKHWFLCWTAWCMGGKTNLNLTSYFFPQLRRRSAARTGWVSLRGHLGALLLSTSSEIPRLCTSLFQNLANIFCWCVFPCCLCLLPVLHHNILLSNCRPIPGFEWLSRHQQSHQWSESINWVLCFLFF